MTEKGMGRKRKNEREWEKQREGMINREKNEREKKYEEERK